MFFEDFAPGQRFQTASHKITEEEIIAFAQQWDRQPFHLDREAAKDTIYGGIIASGWHTLLIAFDLVVRAGVWNESEENMSLKAFVMIGHGQRFRPKTYGQKYALSLQ